ncbi:MAG: ribonuclease HII [Wenzhouxiangellaceae bacterium]|nr:ribonuclease HII [Wenzhouxiangellaceae bacterium]
MAAKFSLPKWPTLYLEREFDGTVCGVDEAGCAPLAGPVVAAAVMLGQDTKPRQLRGLTDSKLLDAPQRARFFEIIQRIAQVGVGMASVQEIDRLNIYHADRLAMQRAVAQLDPVPGLALVDGRDAPVLQCPTRALVKGDRRSLSIAAASVVAKVVRDRLMHKLAERFPDYGWQTNVGYGTDAHYLGLLRKGPTEHHRRSFAPLNTIFSPDGPNISRFSFKSVDRLQLDGLELLLLRQDLHAIFDAAGHHLGVLRKMRSGWTLHAIGYGNDGVPQHGSGPLAAFHGENLDGPERRMLLALFAQRKTGA